MAKKPTINLYIDDDNCLDIVRLQKAELENLHTLAKELSIENCNQLKRNELIFKILQSNSCENFTIRAQGCLEILPEGFGFLRTNNYMPSPEDIYISNSQIRKFQLQIGDIVSGHIRPPKEKERFFSLLRVEKINSFRFN